MVQRDPVTGQPGEGPTSIETKEFFRTSEFWVLAVAAFGLLVTAVASGTFGAEDAWPLGTVLAATYILARGVAKMGTAHSYHGRMDLRTIRERVADAVGGDGSIRQRHGESAYGTEQRTTAHVGGATERRYPTEPIPPRIPGANEQPPYGHPGAPQG